MKLIPYNKFTIETPYKPEELSRRLESVTTIGTELILYKKATTPFVGNITQKGFKLALSSYNPMTNMYKTNSFSPVIRGVYRPTSSTTQITIKQRLTFPVIVVSSIWTLGVLFFQLMFLLVLLQGEPFSVFMLFPLFMLTFMLILMVPGFWKDVEKSKGILLRVLLQ